MSALKQLIWDNRDDRDEEVDGSKGDYPSGRLNGTLSTGIFDMRPTEESLAIKAKNRELRASRKEQERSQDSDS